MVKKKAEKQYTEEALQKKTVAELKDIIKEKGLKVTSKMRKADLIALILGENAGSVLDDATKKLAERIQKELDEANKKLKVPVVVYPAITKNPPRLLEDDMLINSKLIRPGLIESVFPLAEDLYMVSYFIMQKDCIIACCCLGDLLDFVKNGVEQQGGVAVLKKHFRKKYPYLASLYDVKPDGIGKWPAMPYLMTIAWESEEPRWYLTEKIYDGDFPSMVYYGVVNDQKALEVLFHFREALDKMWKELEKSDAKAPKARMKEYFGVDNLEIED
ncbi:Rho termination factor N-terminal domain-containing protein [uncultured Prevotella sp.]|uniref:Rho termination factor N-terminal domain-containing protein n=1 Tax=uncultured Prevotella sp. TaxID=159272 RepID=UPI0025F3DDC4|nr:Rho termination factor N-terminal domain-containing protein [uncultured Prevotella sp.]